MEQIPYTFELNPYWYLKDPEILDLNKNLC